VFFFEKKNQKTFAFLVPRKLTPHASGGEGEIAKVFCLFFFKKEELLLL
jgi:hypothetical protein